MIDIIQSADGKPYFVDPHQQTAYKFLFDNPVSGLFLEMSLSKTVVMLTYLYEMTYREAAISKTLVISTDKVIRVTWPNEIANWQHVRDFNYSVIAGEPGEREAAINADAEIYFISVDNLVKLIERYKYKLPYDCVVIDESSLFKNASSKRFKALRKAQVKSNIKYFHIMTGTPAAKGYTDLWAQIYLLDQGKRLGKTYTEYTAKYFKSRGNGMITYEYILLPGADSAINKKIADICITMKTRDYIEMQPEIIHDVILEFSEMDLGIYEMLEREYVLEVADVTVKTAADLGNKLLQLSGGAVYSDEGKTPIIINNLKINALVSLVAQIDGNVIIAYNYQHERERILKALPTAVALPRGAKVKQVVDDWNAGKIPILVMHPASGGHGLNLQHGGRDLIWYTGTFDLDKYLQMNARISRRNTTTPSNIRRLIVKGTRDAKVYRVLDRREKVQTFLMNDVKELRKKYGKVY